MIRHARTRTETRGLAAALLVALGLGVTGVEVAVVDATSPERGELTSRLDVSDAPPPPYQRSAFGSSAWTDDDRDCQNTRAEVLIAQSEEPVRFRPPDDCVVESGFWHDPWSGRDYTNAGDVDIDHLVPLANAWRSGAYRWSPEMRIQYANDLGDPDHLIAISASDNRRKRDGGPEKWQPDDESTWCYYAQTWVEIKERWRLTATTREVEALSTMLATC